MNLRPRQLAYMLKSKLAEQISIDHTRMTESRGTVLGLVQQLMTVVQQDGLTAVAGCMLPSIRPPRPGFACTQ